MMKVLSTDHAGNKAAMLVAFGSYYEAMTQGAIEDGMTEISYEVEIDGAVVGRLLVGT